MNSTEMKRSTAMATAMEGSAATTTERAIDGSTAMDGSMATATAMDLTAMEGSQSGQDILPNAANNPLSPCPPPYGCGRINAAPQAHVRSAKKVYPQMRKVMGYPAILGALFDSSRHRRLVELDG
jgi:hypothetical protein